jgi:hypothetical protein
MGVSVNFYVVGEKMARNGHKTDQSVANFGHQALGLKKM